jgi:hypothetical protein
LVIAIGRSCRARQSGEAGGKSLYRLLNGSRDCVFAFGILPTESLDKAEVGAANYTYLMKYDCRSSKAVGFFFTAVDQDHTATTPVYLERAWQKDSDAEDAVQKFGKFIRPLNSQPGTAYRLDNGQEDKVAGEKLG